MRSFAKSSVVARFVERGRRHEAFALAGDHVMKAGMQRLGEILVEIPQEVGDFESVKTTEQTFDVVADLTVTVEFEGLDAQRFGQRQQTVHPVFVALGAHRRVATAFESRTDGRERDATVAERNWMED